MGEDRSLSHDRDEDPTGPRLRAGDAAGKAPRSRPGEPVARWTPDLGVVAPRRLSPLLPRRQAPHLLVEVDGSPAGHGALVWALREAARREGTVIAVCVLDDEADALLGGAGRAPAREQAAALERLDAQVLRAIAETGVQGRARACVLDRTVFEALTAAAHGADLVVVGPGGKTLLRQAVPRPPARRLARGA
jgi:nucleotide-binding universal stress UspA family protein